MSTLIEPVEAQWPPLPVLANYMNPITNQVMSANVNVAGVEFSKLGNAFLAVPYSQAVELAAQFEAADPLKRTFTVNGYADVGWYDLVKPAPLEPTPTMPLDTPGFWQVVCTGMTYLAAPYIASQQLAGATKQGYWKATQPSPKNFPNTVQFQWVVG